MFVDKMPEDVRIITAPDIVVLKILQTKKFMSHYDYQSVHFNKYNPQAQFEVWKYRIKILKGKLFYPYGIYINKRDFHFHADSCGEIWVGKKWLDRRLAERNKRRS